MQKLNQAHIANDSFVYRPPYFLLPQNSSLECQDELMPLLSYEEEYATICESLHGINKKKYYTSKNGIDTEKAILLWSYLTEMTKLPDWNIFSTSTLFHKFRYLHKT